MEENNGTTDINISKDSKCHIWNKEDISHEDLMQMLAIIKTYEDESHLTRHLLKCKNCGQLYFYEFYEEIDWEHGNDPQYCTWIPVETENSGDLMNKLNIWDIHHFSRIIYDWPREAKTATGPKKIISIQ